MARQDATSYIVQITNNTMNEGDNSYAISPWGPRAKQLTMIRCNLIALHPPQTSLKRSSYESGLTGFDSVVSVHSNNNMLSCVVKSIQLKGRPASL